ncbi:MAG: hypothetical protein JST45_13385 [Bacteroidetes bacterium]|nr:hypothetical protein [Bacteroidota bacterium]
MATERKDANTATATQERYQTGSQARDEQSPGMANGNKNLNENWRETKAELKKNFNQLTEEDLELKPGREQEMIDRISQRLKKTPEEANRLVRDTAKRFQSITGSATAEIAKANQRLHETWHKTKDALKKDFGKLTEEDLELKPGREQETFDRIGKRLNRTADEAGRLVRDTAKRFQTPVNEENKSKITA